MKSLSHIAFMLSCSCGNKARLFCEEVSKLSARVKLLKVSVKNKYILFMVGEYSNGKSTLIKV